MNVLSWILLIVTIYFFLVFVVARLVAPFYGFEPWEAPPTLPPAMRETILQLEDKSADQKVYLRGVYDLVLEKTLRQWKHTRFKAGTHLNRGFLKDVSEIWETKDFVYCTAINYIAFCLLAGSRYFKASDVKAKVVFLNFVAHQYLRVKAGETWIDFDPAGSGIRGKPLGTHAALFG